MLTENCYNDHLRNAATFSKFCQNILTRRMSSISSICFWYLSCYAGKHQTICSSFPMTTFSQLPSLDGTEQIFNFFNPAIYVAFSSYSSSFSRQYLVLVCGLVPTTNRLDQLAWLTLRRGLILHKTFIRSTRSSPLKLSSSTTLSLKRMALWWKRTLSLKVALIFAGHGGDDCG